MWLAYVAESDGSICSKDLEERKRSLNNISLDDFKYRYIALQEAGFVDNLVHAWGNPVIKVRLTEEGRSSAESFLEAELSSQLISDETKKSIKDTLVSQGISAAFKLFLLSIGFIV